MNGRARVRGRRRPGEDGFTLVELLAAMAVSMVVMAVVTGAVVRALRIQSRQTIQVVSLSDSRLALERVTRDIRGADLKVAALDRIRLDVRGPGGGVDHTVTYERVGNHLLATDAATGVARELVDDLVPGPPLFLFHLVDGSTATGAHAIDLPSVHSITVHLQVEPNGEGRVVDLTNRVRMRNAEL